MNNSLSEIKKRLLEFLAETKYLAAVTFSTDDQNIFTNGRSGSDVASGVVFEDFFARNNTHTIQISV